VYRARVIGHCASSTGIEPFGASVDKVMTRQPYASARRVFWIVDNGSSHRGWIAAARLSDAFPNAKMVHLPVRASWLNQVEIYFSVVQRKLLTPDGVRNPLQRGRPTIRLALQPQRPQPTPHANRRITPDELTNGTSSNVSATQIVATG
jgi:hypothetical protein